MRFLPLALLAALPALSQLARAQPYPNRPVRMIVGVRPAAARTPRADRGAEAL
jgi:hypothetical protein